MRITRRVAVIVAIVCALGAALLSVVYLKSLAPKPPVVEPEVARVVVAVPVADLVPGERLTSLKLTTKEVDRDTLDPSVLIKHGQLLGQTLVTPAPAGEPISRSQLAAYSMEAGLSYMVPKGMRAVTVSADNISGVGGFLKLGDRVDVLATFDVGHEVVTRTILQDVEILGLGAEALVPRVKRKEPTEGEGEGEGAETQKAEKIPSVTLAVTPQQAQVLVLSANKASLHLALRAKTDAEIVALPSATTGQVGVELAPPEPPPPPGAQLLPDGTYVGPPLTPAGLGAVQIPSGPGLQPIERKPSVEVIRGDQRERVTP